MGGAWLAAMRVVRFVGGSCVGHSDDACHGGGGVMGAADTLDHGTVAIRYHRYRRVRA